MNETCMIKNAYMYYFFLFFFFERGTKDIITNFIAFLKIADILL